MIKESNDNKKKVFPDIVVIALNRLIFVFSA